MELIIVYSPYYGVMAGFMSSAVLFNQCLGILNPKPWRSVSWRGVRSIQMAPTLGSNVYKWYLLWAIWSFRGLRFRSLRLKLAGLCLGYRGFRAHRLMLGLQGLGV